MPKVQYKCEHCGHVQVRITWKQLPSTVCPKCQHVAHRITPKFPSRLMAMPRR